MVLIKRFLDAGVQTLLIPYVQTAEEAAAAVAYTRYPLRGVRGVAGTTRATRFGRVKDYFKRAEEELCVLVQVETRLGLDNLEAIADTDGIDGVFIGPADLSAGLGHLGNIPHPEVQKAIDDAIRRTGLPQLSRRDLLAAYAFDLQEAHGYTFADLKKSLGLGDVNVARELLGTHEAWRLNERVDAAGGPIPGWEPKRPAE